MGRVNQRYSCVVRGHTLPRVDVRAERVKELWSDCEGWGEWELGDDYQVIGGKIGGRQRDRRTLPDNKKVVSQLVVSEGSELGFDERLQGDSGCPGFVGARTCRPCSGVAR